jgi:hypothetical protein
MTHPPGGRPATSRLDGSLPDAGRYSQTEVSNLRLSPRRSGRSRQTRAKCSHPTSGLGKHIGPSGKPRIIDVAGSPEPSAPPGRTAAAVATRPKIRHSAGRPPDSRPRWIPSLFGDRLAEFEAEFRRVLAEASPSGLFSEQSRDTEVLVWRKPGRQAASTRFSHSAPQRSRKAQHSSAIVRRSLPSNRGLSRSPPPT